MEAKEKAIELVDIFYFRLDNSMTPINDVDCMFEAKQCALIAVDEIINHHSQEQGLYRVDTYYWQEVKKEIELL